VDFDFEALIQNDPCALEAMNTGSLAQLASAMKDFQPDDVMKRVFKPLLDDVFVYNPILLVSGVISRLLGLNLAERYAMPVFWVDLQLNKPSRCYPSLLLDQFTSRDTLQCLNRLSHEPIVWLLSDVSAHPDWVTRELLGFPKDDVIPGRVIRDFARDSSPFPWCICVSPTLVPPPDDWDPLTKLCAPLILPLAATMVRRPPQESLVAFIEAGDAPIYLGWGSMSCKGASHMTTLACRALYEIKQRGVILSGWAGLGLDHLDESEEDYANLIAFAEKNVYFGNDLPHEWLFPRCKATVHHGGAGTTHAALRAGIPTVITPVFLDQFSYRRLVVARGCGVGGPHLGKLTASKLAACITEALGKAAVAKEVGMLMHNEDGVKDVVKSIEDFLATDVASGRWRKAFGKRWVSKLVRPTPVPEDFPRF
jgi:sterol 3beta-glucosyltransferase